MRYTFKTYQRGVLGADACVFADGVHIWTSPILQAVADGDSDRKKAARVAREWIADRKVIDSMRRK